MKNVIRTILLSLMLQATGCATIREWIDEHWHPKPEPEFPIGLRWLHTDVSAWPVTATLGEVRIGRRIEMPYDKANVWPGRDHVGAHVNANPWVIVNHRGQWYAATWEWLRVGQQDKAAAALEPGHIKRRELDDWMPVSGEEYGFMVSGLARDHVRNVSERSNVVWITWPE